MKSEVLGPLSQAEHIRFTFESKKQEATFMNLAVEVL